MQGRSASNYWYTFVLPKKSRALAALHKEMIHLLAKGQMATPLVSSTHNHRSVCWRIFLHLMGGQNKHTNTAKHTHTHIYIYKYCHGQDDRWRIGHFSHHQDNTNAMSNTASGKSLEAERAEADGMPLMTSVAAR